MFTSNSKLKIPQRLLEEDALVMSDFESPRKRVKFSEAVAELEAQIDEPLDYSSSDLDEPQSKPPSKSCNSTDFERKEYTSLLAALKAEEDRDSARHLLQTALLRVSKGPKYTTHKVQSKYTRWPSLTSENAEGELRRELSALIHRIAYRRIHSRGRTPSSEELSDEILDPLVSTLMEQIQNLIDVMMLTSGCIGLKTAYVRRKPALQWDHVLSAFAKTGADVSALQAQCERLFQ